MCFALAYQDLTAVLGIAHKDTKLDWKPLVVMGSLANEQVPGFGMQIAGEVLEMVAKTNWAVHFDMEQHSCSWPETILSRAAGSPWLETGL